jgi:hypothetical protein
MLRARLITKAVRMIAPGIIMGMQEETDAGPASAPAPLLAEASDQMREIKGASGGAGPRLEGAVTGEPVAEQTLEQLIAEDHQILLPEAVEFCIHRRMLQEGQTLSDLTPAARRKIVKNLPDFIVKVREFLVEKATAANGAEQDGAQS